MWLSAEVIATLVGAVLGFTLTALWNIVQDYLKERLLKKEVLADFKSELIHIYKDNEYNYLHTNIMPDLPTIKLKNNALEELIKNDWIPMNPANTYENIMSIWKHIDNINRAIYYKDDSLVRKNAEIIKKMNEVIYAESKALRDDLSKLSEANLDGLGDFARNIFGKR